MAWARVRLYEIFRRGGVSGTAAIEFAMMTPFLLVLIGGVVDFGFAMYEEMQVNAAVEAGILYAAAHGWSFNGMVAAETAATQLPAAYPALTTSFSALTAPALVPSEFCGCPTATGVSLIAGTDTAAGAAPACATSYPTSCSGSAAAGTYVQVGARINHLSLFPADFGLPATFTAIKVIRIE